MVNQEFELQFLHNWIWTTNLKHMNLNYKPWKYEFWIGNLEKKKVKLRKLYKFVNAIWLHLRVNESDYIYMYSIAGDTLTFKNIPVNFPHRDTLSIEWG